MEKETTCANFTHISVDKNQTYNTTLYNLHDIVFINKIKWRIEARTSYLSLYIVTYLSMFYYFQKYILYISKLRFSGI